MTTIGSLEHCKTSGATAPYQFCATRSLGLLGGLIRRQSGHVLERLCDQHDRDDDPDRVAEHEREPEVQRVVEGKREVTVDGDVGIAVHDFRHNERDGAEQSEKNSNTNENWAQFHEHNTITRCRQRTAMRTRQLPALRGTGAAAPAHGRQISTMDPLTIAPSA
jgi:hypothetical protein